MPWRHGWAQSLTDFIQWMCAPNVQGTKILGKSCDTTAHELIEPFILYPIKRGWLWYTSISLLHSEMRLLCSLLWSADHDNVKISECVYVLRETKNQVSWKFTLAYVLTASLSSLQIPVFVGSINNLPSWTFYWSHISAEIGDLYRFKGCPYS